MGQQQDRGEWVMLRRLGVRHRSAHWVGLAIAATLLLGGNTVGLAQQALSPEPQIRLAQASSEIATFSLIGTLDENSYGLEGGTYINTYSVEGVAGQVVVIDLISDEFDAYLVVLGPDKTVVGQNNNGGGGTNAQVVMTLPATGVYLVGVTSHNPSGVGQYQLSWGPLSADENDVPNRLIAADRLGREGIAFLEANQYEAAEDSMLRSLAIYESIYPQPYGDISNSYNNLAGVYQRQGRYAEAEEYYLKVLAIDQQRLPQNHPDVATLYDNLAIFYRVVGRYTESENYCAKAISIRELVLPENHPDIADSYTCLGTTYGAQGQYVTAKDYYLRALAIYQQSLPESELELINAYKALGGLFLEQGEYIESEDFLLEALSISEKSSSDRQYPISLIYNTLGILYHSQGRYAEAEVYLLRSLAIQEQILSVNHPDLARGYSNLALLHMLDPSRHAEAETYLLRVIDIFESTLPNHSNTASAYSNLAGLYHISGRPQAAEPYYVKALELFERSLPENHPLIATGYNNLGEINASLENYSEAETYYRKSLDILIRSRPENHPDTASIYGNLALLYQAMGNIPQALAFLHRTMTVEEINVGHNLAIGSESRKLAYMSTLYGTPSLAISFHLQSAPTNLDAARLALTTVLRRKGRVLDAVTDTQQRLRQNLNPDLAPLLDEYTAVQTQLATQFYGGLGDQDPEVYRARIYDLREKANRLENELSRRSAEFRVETTPVDIEAIQALMPTDAALVELVQYHPFNLAASQSDRWGEPRYAAYILHPSGDLQWADLGDAATIDAAAVAFLAATRTPNSGHRARTTARELDALLMAPLRPLLGDATHLLLSPDGQLNRVPFAALVDEQNRYLVETYTLTHLTTGRDLLRLQDSAPSRQPPVILANPNYDIADPSGVQLVAASTSPRPQGNLTGRRATDQRSTDIADLRFGPLPGTEREVQAIAPLLPDTALILTEAAATENALKQVQGPSILHIATHGFFLEDVEFVPPGNPRGEIELVSAAPGSLPTSSNRPTSTENPLLRSGLALAGFNSRASGGEDGVLTALEAAGLDLRGTRLVVLSACETGVGAATNGEGVYGLRRAFVMAGAESQLMSLWKVDDEGTADLMAQYYNRLLAGAGRSESLRQVQLAFLQTGGVQQHPYYWASFLFSGNWHPLPADEQ